MTRKTAFLSLLFSFLFTAVILSLSKDASAFKLPDTGQTKCYDVYTYAEIPCAGTGQDGEYNINPMSFTNNGDGTVTDNNTGLMWQQDENPTSYNWYQASGKFHSLYNPTSQDVCGELTTGSYTDWRLPTKKELMSIVDYSISYPGPTINTAYFPDAKAYFYWSSTTDAGHSYFAWYVYFDGGDVSSYSKHNNWYVRCVRGGELEFGNFVDNYDGTITDNSTGLMWQQGETSSMTWANALNYCENLELPSGSGQTDWRLPNIKELESITDDTIYDPFNPIAIDRNFFPNAYGSAYWSSTNRADYPGNAWYVYFLNGRGSYSNKVDSYMYARCVRGGHSPLLVNLITRYYNSILNRVPEPGSAEGWTSEIERIDALGLDIKEGFIALGRLFFNSGEYLNINTTDNEYVTDLYETFLGRTPTQGEADYWSGQLSGGLTRNLLLNYFIFSAEFRQYMTDYFGDTTVRPEYNLVNDLYRGMLSRLPDNGGFNYWLAQMQAAQCNGDPQAIRGLTGQIALNFLQSQEYLDRNTSNSEYIEDLYNGILRRGADIAGYHYWLEQLNPGSHTRAEMMQLFVDSVEFQTKVQQVIDAGCAY